MNEQRKSMVNQLIDLSQKISQLKYQLDEHVKQIAHEYIESKKLTVEHAGYGWPSNVLKNLDEFTWDIDGNGVVNCTWSEHWNYGGHDQGSFEFSSEFLHNPESLENYKKICQQEHERLATEKKEQERQRDQRELQRLQQKLTA